MTTTATTARNNSASKSSPNDSQGLHETDSDGASAPPSAEQQQKQEHNHTKHNNDPDDLELSPSPPTRARLESSSPPAQSPDNNVTNKLGSKTPPTPIATTTITTTSSSSSLSPRTVAADKLQSQHLEQSPSSQQQQSTTSNSNNNTEQKRPMNAFLLFCKRQRSSVREKYPNLENRGISRILGAWWSKLDKEQKSKYTDLARQHKEAFMKAHPDFKWCKTPNVSNINNNIRTNNTNNEGCSNSTTTTTVANQQQQPSPQTRLPQNNHQPGAATAAELLSLQSNHHPMDVVNHSSNGIDFLPTSRQQVEAPKPPKKRFLERNDLIYTAKNNYISNQHETNTQGTDVVPYISFDQDTLNRVVDKIFSEDLSSSPSGANTCKGSNRNPTNLTSSSGNSNPTSFSSTSTNNYTTNTDEPVDFSMSRTFNTTRQEIIDNLVEKMLSEPSDDSSSFSKLNGTDSVRPNIRQPVKRDNPDDT